MTENICFPIPQQTGGGRLKTSKTVDSPRLGRLAVLVLSAYVGNLYVSLLRARTVAIRIKPLFLAGLLTGLATGAKLTAVPYAVGLAAATIVAFPPRRLAITLVIVGLGGAVGVFATGGFWMAHLYATYGDPIFPYDNQIFNSNWAGPWAYNDARFFPHSRREWLLFPFWWARRNAMVVTEIPFADPRLAAIFLLALFALFAALFRRRLSSILPPPEWRAAVIFWVIAYITWEKLFSIYRYAIPLEIIGGMIFVGAVHTLLPSKPRFTTTAAGILTTAIWAVSIYPNWGHRPFHGAAIPVQMPTLPQRSLIVSTSTQAVSFLALRAPADTVFVGANNNFLVPDTTLTWRAITNTIETWRDPIEIIEPAKGDSTGRAIVAAEFNVIATDQCKTIDAAWNDNALRICEAHLQGAIPDYQSDISFNFTAGDPGARYLRGCWAQPESFGRWTIGSDAIIVLPVNPANRNPLRLTVLAFSVPSGKTPGRHVQVYANGSMITRWALNVNRHAKGTPYRRAKRTPLVRQFGLVQVANRRVPRARVARFTCAGVAGAWEVPVCSPGQAGHGRWNAGAAFRRGF